VSGEGSDQDEATAFEKPLVSQPSERLRSSGRWEGWPQVAQLVRASAEVGSGSACVRASSDVSMSSAGQYLV
jgi:hypothetical protein